MARVDWLGLSAPPPDRHRTGPRSIRKTKKENVLSQPGVKQMLTTPIAKWLSPERC